MKIIEETTIGELMDLLRESQKHLRSYLDDPILSIKIFSDGSFEIAESYYESSATCNSNLNIHNEFTGKEVSRNIINNLIRSGKL